MSYGYITKLNDMVNKEHVRCNNRYSSHGNGTATIYSFTEEPKIITLYHRHLNSFIKL